MTKQNETVMAQQSANCEAKKPYQTPELTVHGKVDEITQALPFAGHVS